MTEPEQTPTTDETAAPDDVTVAVPDYTGPDEAAQTEDAAEETPADDDEANAEPGETEEAAAEDTGTEVDPVQQARWDAVGYPAGSDIHKD